MAFAYPTVFRSSPGAHSILLCLNLLHKVVCSRLLSGYMIDNLKSRNFLESEQNWAPLLDALRIPSFFRSQNWRENLQETSEKKIMVFAPSPWFLVISTVYLYLYPSISISLYIYMHISYISLNKNHNFSIDPQVFQPVPRCGCGRHLAPRASSRRLLRRTRPAVQRAPLGQGERFVEGRHQFFLELLRHQKFVFFHFSLQTWNLAIVKK